MAMAASSFGTAPKVMQAFNPASKSGTTINLRLRCLRTALPILNQLHDIAVHTGKVVPAGMERGHVNLVFKFFRMVRRNKALDLVHVPTKAILADEDVPDFIQWGG